MLIPIPGAEGKDLSPVLCMDPADGPARFPNYKRSTLESGHSPSRTGRPVTEEPAVPEPAVEDPLTIEE